MKHLWIYFKDIIMCLKNIPILAGYLTCLKRPAKARIDDLHIARASRRLKSNTCGGRFQIGLCMLSHS